MTPSSLNSEIKYRIEERLALLGFFHQVPGDVHRQIQAEVHAEVRERWPKQYAEAVQLGYVTK